MNTEQEDSFRKLTTLQKLNYNLRIIIDTKQLPVSTMSTKTQTKMDIYSISRAAHNER